MGENMGNGTRVKTVLTEIGPVEIEVPKDRDGSFELVIVPKRKCRVGGVDQVVLSLSARGLTTGEIVAHFDEVYGAKVCKDTISQIAEKVSGELAEWSSRPLDPLYPVIFVDAIVVKVGDGQVRNTPFYVVMGVTVNGKRDILGIWAGDGQEGARFWLQVFTEVKNRGIEDVLIAVCDGLKGSFKGAQHHLGANGRPAVHRPPNPQQLPLLRAPTPRRERPFPQTRPHRPVKAGAKGSIRKARRRVGPEVPGDRASLAQLLSKVRAVPRVQRQDPASNLHHQRNRVKQHPLQAGRPSARALPK